VTVPSFRKNEEAKRDFSHLRQRIDAFTCEAEQQKLHNKRIWLARVVMPQQNSVSCQALCRLHYTRASMEPAS
jgi:hypothetical protein